MTETTTPVEAAAAEAAAVDLFETPAETPATDAPETDEEAEFQALLAAEEADAAAEPTPETTEEIAPEAEEIAPEAEEIELVPTEMDPATDPNAGPIPQTEPELEPAPEPIDDGMRTVTVPFWPSSEDISLFVNGRTITFAEGTPARIPAAYVEVLRATNVPFIEGEPS